MTTRLTAAAAGLAAAALAVAGVAAAKPPPRLLDPDSAAALVADTSHEVDGFSTRSVSPTEAFAAASIDGATVWVDPELTLSQAVGIDVTSSLALAGAAVAAATTGCWSSAYWHQWGTWPYQQKITDTTYWCAVYGSRITYRSSTATATGALCGTSWRSSQLVAGGLGYSWFTMRSSAGWSCPTVIPWVTLHPSHYEDVARNVWGSTSLVRSG